MELRKSSISSKSNLFESYRAASVGIVKPLIKVVESLPPDWKNRPDLTQAIGNRWIESRESAVLAVPSALYDCALDRPTNYLINPNHPAFELLQISALTEIQLKSQ